MKKKPALPPSPPLSPRSDPPPRRGPQLAPSTPPPVMTAPPLRMDDDDDDDAPPFDAEAAARDRERAVHARHTFAGHALQPLSIARQRLLLDIRGAAGAGAFGTMDALFGDALRFTWLCLHEGEELEAMTAGIGLPGSSAWPVAHRLQIAIDRWAERNDALIRASRAAMVETFTRAWLDSQSTQAVPESAAAADDDAGN